MGRTPGRIQMAMAALAICWLSAGLQLLKAQVPVMGFQVFHDGQFVRPDHPEFELRLEYGGYIRDNYQATKEPVPNLLTVMNPDSFFVPYVYAHEIPGVAYPYDLIVCYGYDTMLVHIRTWFVDWEVANFLVVYQPGEFCFDMKDGAEAHRGISPLDIRPFLRAKGEGDCFD